MNPDQGRPQESQIEPPLRVDLFFPRPDLPVPGRDTDHESDHN